MRNDEETRADIARRRLAQLTAAFEDRESEPAPVPARATHKLESQHLKVVAALIAAAVVVTLWWLLAERPQSAPAAPALAVSTPSASTATPTQFVIDVEGKVVHPGIVTLAPGTRVVDALKAAGGLKGKVDISMLNLARKVVDGEQILVGIAPAPGTVAAPGNPAVLGAAAKLNLNTATLDQLDELPGVGPVTAKAIVDWRGKNGPFAKVEDLLEVKGIGEATLDDLKDLVTV